MSVEIKVLVEGGATLPSYQSDGAAGMDICANADFSIKPMERKLVSTGLRVAIPIGFEGQIRPRSGLALKHGIGMVNSPGTIDSDYRGEIGLILINLGSAEVAIQKGERIAQMVVGPAPRAIVVEVQVLDDTERGSGGFGSTGAR